MSINLRPIPPETRVVDPLIQSTSGTPITPVQNLQRLEQQLKEYGESLSRTREGDSKVNHSIDAAQVEKAVDKVMQKSASCVFTTKWGCKKIETFFNIDDKTFYDQVKVVLIQDVLNLDEATSRKCLASVPTPCLDAGIVQLCSMVTFETYSCCKSDKAGGKTETFRMDFMHTMPYTQKLINDRTKFKIMRIDGYNDFQSKNFPVLYYKIVFGTSLAHLQKNFIKIKDLKDDKFPKISSLVGKSFLILNKDSTPFHNLGRINERNENKRN